MAYRILNFIDDNKGRQLQTQDYAEAFGKSYRRLNTIFLSVYGMTIKQMQIVLGMDQAKRMRSSGDRSAAGNDLWRQKANPRQNGKGQSGKRAAFSAMPRL